MSEAENQVSAPGPAQGDVPVTEDGVTFTPQFAASVKGHAMTVLKEAISVAERFEMPLVAVFVTENQPRDENDSSTAFSGVNCPLIVADSMLHTGMTILASEQEKIGAAH